MIRLYFNAHGHLPWNIDSGPNTPQLEFAEVDIICIYGKCVYDPTVTSPDQPKAWVEFDLARILSRGRKASIEPIDSNPEEM